MPNGSNHPNKHHTKTKGDLAVAKITADLMSKGYFVLVPFATEHLPFDLVVYDSNQKFYRIQVKYISGKHPELKNKTTYSDKNGNHYRKYGENDFDYYGIYSPEMEICIYPSKKFRGRLVRFELPKGRNKNGYLWYQDFLDLTDTEIKRTEFIPLPKTRQPRLKNRKVARPVKDELEKLVWSESTSTIAKRFGVSDVAIAKWCKSYGISKPPRGYWAKQSAKQS